MPDDVDEATLSVVAHNLRGAIGLAAGAARTVRLRWDVLDADRRGGLLGWPPPAGPPWSRGRRPGIASSA